MSHTLEHIAEQLRDTPKKVQLIYAFNGTGKTRLSRAFKNLIAPKADEADDIAPPQRKFLYYNAFTEDLFYWDNDLDGDAAPKLKIQPNGFTNWVLKDQDKGTANRPRGTKNSDILRIKAHRTPAFMVFTSW
jgi:hypothetical protein